MFFNGADEGALRHRAYHRHDALPLVEQHQRGYVPYLKLCHGLGVIVGAELQHLQLSSVLIDDLVYDRSNHTTRATPLGNWGRG